MASHRRVAFLREGSARSHCPMHHLGNHTQKRDREQWVDKGPIQVQVSWEELLLSYGQPQDQPEI